MKAFIFVLVFAALLVSCSTTYRTAYTDYDRSVDFSSYKTFAWLPDKADTSNTPYNNEIIRNNIRNFLGQCLINRSYHFERDSPDLLLQLVVVNTKKESMSASTSNPVLNYYKPYYFGSIYYNPYPSNYYYQYYPNYAPYSYSSPYSYSFGYSNTKRNEYVNGAITLNVIDRNKNRVIWTATAEGDIYDPAIIGKDIHPAVHSIIKQYPIKPLGKNSYRN